MARPTPNRARRRAAPVDPVNLAGVAVVTGAGSGIGRATARRLAGLGATVHVVDVSEGAAEAVRAELEAAGARARAHTVDVADAAAVEALAARVFELEGGVDVLHNNAGIGHSGPVEETTLEDWRRIVEINLMGVVHGVLAFVPRLLEQGRPAHIVNTASALGLVPGIDVAPYCTTKHAVVGLSQSLDTELSPRGIGVTALCPGIISTAIVRDSTMRGENARRQQHVVDLYARRGAAPEVVADAVVKAIRRRRPIQPVPAWHVYPAWVANRISARAGERAARLADRLVWGRR
jgi:NAD(P)-dependent dehydrogenase (short-subunit alcohol dehydrogenase family)